MNTLLGDLTVFHVLTIPVVGWLAVRLGELLGHDTDQPRPPPPGLDQRYGATPSTFAVKTAGSAVPIAVLASTPPQEPTHPVLAATEGGEPASVSVAAVAPQITPAKDVEAFSQEPIVLPTDGAVPEDAVPAWPDVPWAITNPAEIAALRARIAWHSKPWWRRLGRRTDRASPPCPPA